MKIGLISDTHGRLDSRALEIFSGVDRILHAGDVGGEEILAELEAVAPVTAVLGNTDGFPLASRLKESELVDLGGKRLLLIHQVGHPERPAPAVTSLLSKHAISLVVFGHTHAPFDRTLGAVRYLNPGGAGPRRFQLPRSVALLELGPREVAVEFVALDETSEMLLKEGSW
jgi:putative phosphoesterase